MTSELKGSTLEHYNCYTLYMQITTQFQSRVGAIFSLQSNNGAMYDTNQMIEFEKINILYQKEIEKSANYCQEFWEEIQQNNHNIAALFRIGRNINSSYMNIKRYYKELLSRNPNYLEVAYLYKMFVSLCLNFEIEEEESKT